MYKDEKFGEDIIENIRERIKQEKFAVNIEDELNKSKEKKVIEKTESESR